MRQEGLESRGAPGVTAALGWRGRCYFGKIRIYVKMDPRNVAQVSGYSMRVGATQDLLAFNIDLASMM
jgi:hypothetical protein